MNKTDPKLIYENIPIKESEVICVSCSYRWFAVRPVTKPLKDIECPWCGKQGFVIETGETMKQINNEKDMNEEFVTQRVAELLRLKKFDGKTNHYYADGDVGLLRSLSTINWNDVSGYYSAPTVQNAIDWVETKGYWIVYRPLNYNSGVDTYIYTANDEDVWYVVKNFVTPTKYEGLNMALEFCLDNLI